jgi:hypothetical protein
VTRRKNKIQANVARFFFCVLSGRFLICLELRVRQIPAKNVRQLAGKITVLKKLSPRPVMSHNVPYVLMSVVNEEGRTRPKRLRYSIISRKRSLGRRRTCRKIG